MNKRKSSTSNEVMAKRIHVSSPYNNLEQRAPEMHAEVVQRASTSHNPNQTTPMLHNESIIRDKHDISVCGEPPTHTRHRRKRSQQRVKINIQVGSDDNVQSYTSDSDEPQTRTSRQRKQARRRVNIRLHIGKNSVEILGDASDSDDHNSQTRGRRKRSRMHHKNDSRHDRRMSNEGDNDSYSIQENAQHQDDDIEVKGERNQGGKDSNIVIQDEDTITNVQYYSADPIEDGEDGNIAFRPHYQGDDITSKVRRERNRGNNYQGKDGINDIGGDVNDANKPSCSTDSKNSVVMFAPREYISDFECTSSDNDTGDDDDDDDDESWCRPTRLDLQEKIETTWPKDSQYIEPSCFHDDDVEYGGDDDDDGWSTSLRRHTLEEFTGGSPGAHVDLGETPTPVSTFHQIFPASLIKTLRKETNAYASFISHKKRKGADKFWTPVTNEEMTAFLGILVIMGADPKSDLADYWSVDTALRNEKIANVMSRNRFQKIRQYFHANDPSTDPANIQNPMERARQRTNHPMYKIAPVLETVMYRSQKYYNLHQQLTIDEAIVGYKASRNGIPTDFIHRKFKEKGYKVHVLVDSKTNYVGNVKFPTSTGSRRGSAHNISKSMAICDDLIQPISGRHHIVYTQRSNTSIEMADWLHEHHQTYIVGSIRQDRKKFPDSLRTDPQNRNHESDIVKNLHRGQYCARQKGDLVAVTYKDYKVLSLISNCRAGFNNNNERISRLVKPIQSRRKIAYSLPAPEIVADYNRHMIDRASQTRSYLYFPSQRQSHKWWMFVFFYLLDVAMWNSWIIYKELVDDKKSHKLFQVEIGCALIGGFSSRRQQLTTKAPILTTFENHHLVKVQGCRGNSCRMCIKVGRRTAKDNYISSQYKCNECGINLCRDCFLPYHQLACSQPKDGKSTQTDADDQDLAGRLWEVNWNGPIFTAVKEEPSGEI
ncbi:uncharacterized protein LOC144344609 [Saccoglossus kowalevskii]